MNEAGRFSLPAGPGRAARAQRWGAVLGGGALAIYGVTRRSPLGWALAAGGSALAYFGANAARMQRQTFVRSSVAVNTSPHEAYRFWHDFENFPRFMHHLESVSVIGDRRSRWVARGPMSTRISWDAEITSEREGEFLAWRSLPGSEVDVEGSVEFRPATGNRGTVVTANVRYRPPAGRMRHSVAKLLGKSLRFMMEQDLRRFKALIEAGEIPTTEGQPHGPRTMATAAARVFGPDRPIRGEARIIDVLRARRRVS
ncbi:MAG: SRPBCC family protein [Terriglobales bacterium]